MRQRDIGKKVGLWSKTVSALENHPETVTIGSLMKLVPALDLEFSLTPKEHIDDNLFGV